VADAVGEHRHLVADHADVAVAVGVDGERGALVDGRDEEVATRHLQDGLRDRTCAQQPRRAFGQADHAGRGRGELVAERLGHVG